MVKNLPANARDKGSIPDPEGSRMQVAAKTVHHSYWICALEPGIKTAEAHSRVSALQLEKTLQ